MDPVDDGVDGDNYVIFKFRECGLVEVMLSFLPISSSLPGIHSSPPLSGKVQDPDWRTKLVMVIMKLLRAVARLLTGIGQATEAVLNTLHVNGGVIHILQKLLSGQGIIVPHEGSENYWTVIGFLDPRTDLLLQHSSSDNLASDLPPSKFTADLCMMASKLAYENPKIITKVIKEEWKMNLVGVYKCINKYEPTNPTQFFIFTDRPEDARAIVVTFRGTMPFNAYDWSTDFDFSWYELPGIGRIHVGFLEALSLVDRHDMESFSRLKRNASEARKSRRKLKPASGLLVEKTAGSQDPQLLAYDTACDSVKELLKVHTKAEVYVTGHSLGGALATVFTTMLFHNDEELVTSKLVGLYTFGQPRVGDHEFAETMTLKLNGYPSKRFFRIVYANDLVPRVPFDNELFQFKHIEPCCYYTSTYSEKTLTEEPNRNYFSPLFFVWNHLVAIWELLQSFLLHCLYGHGYIESSASTILRVVGLAFPGISGHSPVNYVNAVRLGPTVIRD